MTAFLQRRPIVCACGDHAFVALTKGLVTLVSVSDAHLLETRWTAAARKDGPHVAVRRLVGTSTNVSLHREIMHPSDGVEIDHANRDPLDNRRSNLRACTRAENARNTHKKRATATGLRGVYPNRNGFAAHIRYGGRRHHLGTFATAEEAYAAYCDAAATHHGEFARVDNPPPKAA